jgi:choline-sulfatase
LICDRELFEYYRHKIPIPEPTPEAYLSRLHPAMRRWRERRGVDDLTPEQNHRGLAAYYGLVTQMDRNIGQIVDAVRSSPMAEDTIIIYCSDHGDMACEHGMWWKGCHYEGATRVPLIVSWPARLTRGKTVDAVVSLIDVGPTVLALTSSDPLPDVAGQSLLGFLGKTGTVDGWPNQVWSEYIGTYGDQPSCMVRSGNWKLIYYAEFDSCQLFNLDRDPFEMADRAEDPACREIVRILLDQVHSRWSAQRMLEGWQREQRARDLIARSGHPPMPHSVETDNPPEDANRFDFSQVPGWDEIRKRFEEQESR